MFFVTMNGLEIYLQRETRRGLRRERLYQDRLNPLEVYEEVEVKGLFRFQVEHIQNITAELSEGFPFGL